ncbi:hypothetical protein FOA43_004205 [Brettanomyces nanus]|uniref:Kinesin-like protein n=1 Tax=Eeniella nana TaxID=13502 RepID=A0A875S5A0_EENNA|nr:uncharacterized protein FOA43_004205 [Brettanomyces nanus]QPG76811.1 hypothetical protein FOA43_004205 [Brettanomyces nanus]
MMRPSSSMANMGKAYGNLKRYTPSRVTSGGSLLRRRASSANLSSPSRSVSRLSRRPSSSMSSISSSGSSSGDTNNNNNSVNYTGTIQVAVRPRPLQSSRSMWMINPEANCVYNRDAGEFFYDSVFTPEIDNTTVYTKSVEPVVSKCLEGFNATVFAYGMTGSGKTYSMQGNLGQIGLIDLCVKQIFRHFDITSQKGAQNKVTCSYLEIYNEKLYDLLNPETGMRFGRLSSLGMHSSGNSKEALRIRDDPLYGVKVVGLKEVDVSNASSLLRVIRRGESLRTTGGTDYNERSSRSHAIVLIHLFTKNAPDSPETVSTLCLCDLAGSEKAARQLERRQEGSYINKSLLALGTVIAKLSQGSSFHIPYRDSKLTRLLQPSLSGNSIISVLCTIHLSSQTFGETVNTLRFASRAKNVAYNVKRIQNVKSGYADKYVENLIKENEKLHGEIKQIKDEQVTKEELPSSFGKNKEQMAELVAENKILSEQLEHQKRLNEETVMEQVMNNNESLQKLIQIQIQYQIPDSRFEQAVLGLEQFGKTTMMKMEEMKSYILHLEHKLSEKEYNEAMKGKEDEEVAGKMEIEQLKRALKSKEIIIKALKSTKAMREMFKEPRQINNEIENRAAGGYLKTIDSNVQVP